MICLLTVKSSQPKWLDLAVEEFSNKINYLIKFDLVSLASAKKGRDDFKIKKKIESELILKSTKTSDYVILFDEAGKSLTSIGMAQKIQKLQTHGAQKIIFIIGGAFGVDETVKKRANEVWSLSSFVLNHHIATLVAVEQIYRSASILKNKPYHNE